MHELHVVKYIHFRVDGKEGTGVKLVPSVHLKLSCPPVRGNIWSLHLLQTTTSMFFWPFNVPLVLTVHYTYESDPTKSTPIEERGRPRVSPSRHCASEE